MGREEDSPGPNRYTRSTAQSWRAPAGREGYGQIDTEDAVAMLAGPARRDSDCKTAGADSDPLPGNDNTIMAMELDGSGFFTGDSSTIMLSGSVEPILLGYTNDQVFVFNESENVWHGAQVIAPEPSTALLLGAGCLWLASRRGRRRD